MEKLVQENPSYKGAGGLTMKMRKRLVSAAHCAIRMRSKETDRKKAVKLLKQDLINGPSHCFGIHDRCSPDFCSTVQQRASQPSASTDDNSSAMHDLEDDDDTILGMFTVTVIIIMVCSI